MVMAQHINNREDSEKLIEFCQKLIYLLDSLVNIKIQHEDNIGFMGMCFLSKQAEHLKTIVKLTPS